MTTVLSVVSRALRLTGNIAGATTPDADDAEVARIAFNAMKRAWFGTLIGPRLSPISLTGTAGQAENGGEYSVPAGAAFTLTAPANPKAGARFGVTDANLDFDSYPLTINRNGRLINGAASNLTISTAGAAARYWYRADTSNWVLEADSPSVQSVVEFPDPIVAYLPYMLCMVMAAEFSADITQEVALGAVEGRQVLARTYGRRGAAAMDKPIGLGQPQQAAG